jgi:hypothetical protein
MSSSPNYDLGGMVKLCGETNTVSLSIKIISFFIYTGCGRGFYIVSSFCVASLTREVILISFWGSAAFTTRLILKVMNSWVSGFLK